jgi:3-dehydroquinate dehydratase-2
MFMNVLVINGPNLARLDIRDSSIYGDLSYPQLVEYISKAASGLGFSADVRQSDD